MKRIFAAMVFSIFLSVPALADRHDSISAVPVTTEKTDTVPYNQWSWFWQRWMADDMEGLIFDKAMEQKTVQAIERESTGDFFIRMPDGKLTHYPIAMGDTESGKRILEYARKSNTPYRTVSSSGLLGFLTGLGSLISTFVVLLITIEIIKWFKNRRKMYASIRKGRLNSLMFTDVAGQEGPKADLRDVVQYLRNPAAFETTGARMPSGMLLEGEPGNGKTLLARAIAGEAGVPFFSASGSDFEEMLVGVGAQRLRLLFSMARKYRRSIVFIDEFDVIGLSRKNSRSDSPDQTLTQLLTELDGFDRRNRVFFIGATNLAERLDSALTRAGRLDRKVFVPAPGLTDREAILKLHAKKINLASDVDFSEIARSTPGFSGATLAMMVNEAAIAAANGGRKTVGSDDFRNIMGKVTLGNPNRSMIMNPGERRKVVYHEAGHALACTVIPGANPVRYATILPHGRALGAVVQSPSSDRFLLSRSEYRAQMAVSMAGRVAEELIAEHPDDVTGGAMADIRAVTQLARQMVGGMGMSEDIGEVDMLSDENPVSSAQLMKAVKREIERAKNTAREVLTANIEALHALAREFDNHESVSGEHVRATVSVAMAHAAVSGTGNAV